MKKVRNLSVVVLLAAVLMQSCIGSFKLTRTVYDWNNSIGDKFVNELVFLACIIVPVYGVATFVDAVVLNSIEFWSGENPMTLKEGEKHQKLVEIDGKTYQLTSEKFKMTVEELGVADSKTEMVFRESDNSWYLKKGKKFQKLVEVEIQDGQVISYHVVNPDGSMLTLQPGFDPLAVQDQLHPQPALALQ
ncbi:MAG: DUF3332 domain-containing protein [Mangrovibacterium sp.]